MLVAEKFKILLGHLKPLRMMLALLAILVVLFAPTPGTRVVYEGWAMIQTLLLPTLAPLIFMVLLLDALMGRVWLVDAQGTEKAKFKTIIRVNLFLALLILLVWIPFFIKLWN